jgi:rhodanese-related sulfurtransferase
MAALTAVSLIGCGSSSTKDVTGEPAASGDQQEAVSTDGLMIIDVRTPSEFDEQHLDGAVNINLQADDFVDRISELDRNGSYAVYCRSGNRSAEAVAAMRTLGFTDVTDYGGVSEASQSLGVDIVS